MLLPAPVKWELPIAELAKWELEIFDTARFVEIAEPAALLEFTEPREFAMPVSRFAPAVILGVCELAAVPERDVLAPPAGPPWAQP